MKTTEATDILANDGQITCYAADGELYHADTAEFLRAATDAEQEASDEAANQSFDIGVGTTMKKLADMIDLELARLGTLDMGGCDERSSGGES